MISPHDQPSTNAERRELVDDALRARRAGSFWTFLLSLAALGGLTAAWLSSDGPPTVPAFTTNGLVPANIRELAMTRHGVEAEPRSGAAWGQYGIALMHADFIPQADIAFAAAERYEPKDARWPYLHAVLFLDHEGPSPLEHLRTATRLANRTNDAPRLRLAQFLAEKGDSDGATKAFSTLRRANTNHAAACLGLARLNQRSGHFDTAIRLLEPCLNDPHTAKDAHELAAALQFAQGQREVAAVSTKAAQSLPRDRPWPDPIWDEAAQTQLGMKDALTQANLWAQGGKSTAAIELLRRVTRSNPNKTDPDYLPMQLSLAELLWRAGRTAEARRILDDAERFAPDDSAITNLRHRLN